MSAAVRNALLGGLPLLAAALIGSMLVSLIYEMTRGRIAANERASLVSSLHELLPPERYDNDLLEDVIEIETGDLSGGRIVTVYRARRQNVPVAALAIVVANGYSGPIKLLVAVDVDGSVLGVRVLEHQETPGLGDAVELGRSDWVLSFDRRSLDDPPSSRWTVRKDGGAFDQLSGATTTARAVVRGVQEFLLYFERNEQRLFDPGNTSSNDSVR